MHFVSKLLPRIPRIATQQLIQIRGFATPVWGKIPTTKNEGSPNQNYDRSAGKNRRGGDGEKGGDVGVGHHSAYEKLASVMPETGKFGSTLRSWIPRETQEERAKRIFRESRDTLLSYETWTYGSYLNYQQKLYELIGGHELKTKVLRRNDPNLEHVLNETRVLEAMTATELKSNYHTVFTPESKLLLAEKAGVSKAFVENVIRMHDMLRADRRWYQILKQFNRRLPTDFLDRQQMAEQDRPMSELELDLIKKNQQKEMHFNMQVKKQTVPRFTHIYTRRRSVGGNRWSTQPPRWFPRWHNKDRGNGMPDHLKYHG